MILKRLSTTTIKPVNQNDFRLYQVVFVHINQYKAGNE